MDIKEKLRKLTKHKNIYLTSRGNVAIEHALSLVKGTLLIPDQGSWMSYRKIAKKKELEIVDVKTDNGIIDLDDLRQNIDGADTLIYQNPAGYFADQPIKEIYEICRDKCLVISDISGCIGDEEMCNGEYSDVIVCSFGKWKLVDVEYGGFISSNAELNVQENFDENYLKELDEKLDKVGERLKFLYDKCDNVKNDLIGFDVIHRNKKGIVVVVNFLEEEEKNEIIKYCEKEGYEYTLCPREIRVNCDAVSIEIKRLWI